MTPNFQLRKPQVEEDLADLLLLTECDLSLELRD
jgi:hypothetical protein